jgi:hypothetical protein
MILASTIRNAKAHGTDIEIRKIMDIAKLASRKKMKNSKKLKKMIIEITYIIAKLLVVQKD